MFNSGITAQDLIEQVQSEADIAPDIPSSSYVTWLNSLEQLLYTEVIKEQGKVDTFTLPFEHISFETLSSGIPDDEEAIRFEDVHAVYVDNTQLTKSTLASGHIFPNTYYKGGNDLVLHVTPTIWGDMDIQKLVDIVYIKKPKLKEPGNIGSLNVMLPVEFIDLAKAKLRGEAYKVAHEGELAALWINDYNVLLETFKAWIADKQPAFGL